jgi:hypothetical protein
LCSPEPGRLDGVIRHAGDLPGVLCEAVRRRLGPRTTILIDGPSASGKSTLAEGLIRRWMHVVSPKTVSGGGSVSGEKPPDSGESNIVTALRAPSLVHMDDLYPGWDGLDPGSRRLVDEILGPRLRDVDGRWRGHDWERDAPGAWHMTPADLPLVVEGCGCLSRRSARYADLCVWVDAEEPVRRRRFSRRDRGAFDHEWSRWEDQTAAFIARERPQDLASVFLRSV